MLEITCEKCSRQYHIDSKFLGKKIRCKNCNHPILITAPATATESRGLLDFTPPPPTDDLPDLSDIPPLPELPHDEPSAWEPEPIPAAVTVTPNPNLSAPKPAISITRWVNLAAVLLILIGILLSMQNQMFALSLGATGSIILFVDAIRRPRGPSKVASYVCTLLGIITCGIPALFYYAIIGWRPVGQTDKTYGDGFCRQCHASTSNEGAGNTFTINFLWGTRFLGAAHRCNTCGSTVRTKWLCLGAPLIPLGSYRVIDVEYQRYLSRKTALHLKHVAIVYAIIAILILLPYFFIRR